MTFSLGLEVQMVNVILLQKNIQMLVKDVIKLLIIFHQLMQKFQHVSDVSQKKILYFIFTLPKTILDLNLMDNFFVIDILEFNLMTDHKSPNENWK